VGGAGCVYREYDPCDVRVYVVPSNKIDRALKKLEDVGYDSGPEPSEDFSISEGDHLEVVFRGNVKCVDFIPRLNAVFTSNLDTTMDMRIEQNDVFVQKSYAVYRGFVQLRKITKTPLLPGDKKPAPTGPRASLAAPAQRHSVAVPVSHRPSVAAPTPVSPAQEGEAAAAGDAGATAADPAVTEERPPAPMFEIKVVMLSELLITFPKVSCFAADCVACKSSVQSV